MVGLSHSTCAACSPPLPSASPGRCNTSLADQAAIAAFGASDRRMPGRARAYGIDLSLIDSNLRHTPEERLRTLDANAEFVSALARRKSSGRRHRTGGT